MLIKSLHLKSILSFKDTKLDLQPLNVLIGPNGSGKSNLIDVIGLLQAAPYDVTEYLRRNGPTGDWIWSAPSHSATSLHFAGIEADIEFNNVHVKYDLGIVVGDHRVHSLTERLDLVEQDQSRKVLANPFFQASNQRARLWPTRNDGSLAGYDDGAVRLCGMTLFTSANARAGACGAPVLSAIRARSKGGEPRDALLVNWAKLVI